MRCTTALGLLRAYLLAQSGLFPSSILSPGCMLLFVCGMTPGDCVSLCVCVSKFTVHQMSFDQEMDHRIEVG